MSNFVKQAQSSKHHKLKTHAEAESAETHQPWMNTEVANQLLGIIKIQKILQILQAIVIEQMNNFHQGSFLIRAFKI